MNRKRVVLHRNWIGSSPAPRPAITNVTHGLRNLWWNFCNGRVAAFCAGLNLARVSQPLTYDSDDPLAVWDGPYLWDEEININTNTTMADIKVNYAVEDVLGFSNSTKDMVNTYKTQMIANGIDPTTGLTALDTAQTDLSAQNAVQENLKTQLRDQTVIVDAARDKDYTLASNLCDQIIAAFGKTSEQAQEATNLRKKLHPKSAKKAQNP